ncbi:MAG: MG2 domain-containing protein, partial [Bacteroidales bacterium]
MKNSRFILGAITLAICPFVSIAQNGSDNKPVTLNNFPAFMNQIQLADSLDQPQQVISLTDSIIPLALKAGNDDVVLRAIIYQYNNQNQLNLNNQTANLKAFLDWVEQLHSPSYKAIGYLYFLSKDYPVLFKNPERMVLDNLNECLKTMKNEPVSGFSSIIRLNSFTEIIAPTLGDYLRFIFLSQYKNNRTSDEELSKLTNNYLNELEKSSSVPTRMYAQFLRISNDQSLDDYCSELFKLYEQYKEIPESGVLLSGYFNQDKQKEVELLEDYIKRFPKSDFSESFNYKLAVLNNPISRLSFPYQVYPNTATPFQANSYLMKQFTLNFENDKKKSINQNYVLANPGKYTFEKETLLLPKLSDGTWNIVPNDGQERDYKQTITASKGIGYQISNRIIGLDYRTGEPIKKGSVYLYQDKTVKEYALHDGIYEIPDLKNKKENRYQTNYYAVRKGTTPSIKTFLFQTQKPNKNEQIRTSHLLTDKPIYKPGDSVRFKLWSWETTNKNAQALSNVQGLVYLYDANYKIIDSTQVVTDKYGTAWGGFQLPQFGLNGSHQLVASLDKASKNGVQSSTSFQVEDYKAPTFMIQLNKPDSTYSLNTPIHITGKAYSYNGLPLRNQTIAYSGSYTPLYRFFFGARDQQMNFAVSGEIKTNDEGDFSFAVTTPDEVKTNRFVQIWNLQLTATATDQKGETQSQSLALIVSDKKYRLAINAPAFMDLSKTQPKVNVTARNLTNQNLKVTGRWELLNNQKRTISQGAWNSNEPILWSDFRKFATGEYQLKVSYDNDTISKNIILYNSAKKELAIDTTLMVIPSEESKNRIYLVTSEPELHVLYALSRSDKESEFKWLRLRKGMLSLDLPELPEGVYATVQMATVRNCKFKTETYNYNNAVKLDSLDISLSTFRDKLTPGAKENWTLRISKNGKTNIDQSVLAYMYDKALDTYMPYENPFNVSLIKSNPALNIISSNGFGMNYMN